MKKFTFLLLLISITMVLGCCKHEAEEVTPDPEPVEIKIHGKEVKSGSGVQIYQGESSDHSTWIDTWYVPNFNYKGMNVIKVEPGYFYWADYISKDGQRVYVDFGFLE